MNTAKNLVDNQWELLHFKKNTIQEMMNSDIFKKVRTVILNDQWPGQCSPCFEKEKNNLQSMRMFYKMNDGFNYTYKDAIRDTQGDGSIDVKLLSAELRFSNKCNCKCRMCQPLFSDRLFHDISLLPQEFAEYYTNENEYIDLIESKSLGNKKIWAELIKSKSIQYFYIGGGEPLIQKTHWDFLDFLIEKKLSIPISLVYSTNATSIPKLALYRWSHFQSVTTSMSIDDIGSRAEYLRNGIKWEGIVKNIKKLKEAKEVYANVNLTVSWMNVYYLDEVIGFFNDCHLDYIVSYLYWPNFLRAYLLPEKIKYDILRRCTPLLTEKELIRFKNNVIDKPADSELLKKGIRFHKALDRIRNQNFKTVLPELYKEIKNYWEE